MSGCCTINGNTVMVVGPKDPAEVKVITFDFVDQIGELVGVTIISATVDVVVIDGDDPTPSAILLGGHAIDVLGIKVRQALHDGLDGVTYGLRCLGTDSNGLVHEVPAAMLVKVRPVPEPLVLP